MAKGKLLLTRAKSFFADAPPPSVPVAWKEYDKIDKLEKGKVFVLLKGELTGNVGSKGKLTPRGGVETPYVFIHPNILLIEQFRQKLEKEGWKFY